jgi:hypothetical protein
LGEKLKRKKTSIPPTFQRFSDKTKWGKEERMGKTLVPDKDLVTGTRKGIYAAPGGE